ncbi:MAG: hypothetical protein R3E96_13130 [Planctomycetota bacterium]
MTWLRRWAPPIGAIAGGLALLTWLGAPPQAESRGVSALVALLLTIGIELPIAGAITQTSAPRLDAGGGMRQPAHAAHRISPGASGGILALELAVFAVEAALYSWILDISWHRAISVSLLANGATAAIGCALF